MLSWARDDKSFFASGACHILAYTFFSLHPDKELEIVFLRPAGTASGGTIGCHAYVRQGSWAFDFQGWTLESDYYQLRDRIGRIEFRVGLHYRGSN
jgi:hypothetical protein